MDSLYVCLFSNGLIKVGHSIDPVSRIAAHADRVSCLGVLLAESCFFECKDAADRRERRLIERCAENAANRFQSEWFGGLNFMEVCEWATEASQADMRAAGWTSTSLARECGCGGASMSRLALGQQAEPMHAMGETLLRLHRERIQ